MVRAICVFVSSTSCFARPNALTCDTTTSSSDVARQSKYNVSRARSSGSTSQRRRPE